MDAEGKVVYKPGTAPAGPKISILMLIGLIIVASLSIALFLYIAEPKRPPKYRDMSALSLPADMLPIEMLPYSRYLSKLELAALMKGTEQRDFAGNDDDDISWFCSRSTPRTLLTSDFYIYIGTRDDETWGRLRTGYKTSEALEPDSITISVDGARYDIESAGEVGQMPLSYVDEVYEYVDLPVSSHADIMRHIGHGRDVYVTFRGERGETTAKLTAEQIESTARMMRILTLRQALEKDARERAQKASVAAAKK